MAVRWAGRFNTRMSRSVVAVLALAALGAGCSATARGDAPDTTHLTGPLATIPIDGLPEPLSRGSLAPVPTAPAPPTSAPPSTAAELDPGDPALEPGTVGEHVTGNRLLVIGDSLIASTAPQFQGVLCSVLNTNFGWAVEVHAETGQHIEFADTVLHDRLDPPGVGGFDAVAVMLGNNYRGDYDEYTHRLEALIERLAPMPTVVFTLTERQPDHARLNEYIRWRTYFHPNVIVIDWAEFTAAEPDKLLAGDGLHLSDEGRGRLVMFLAAALGPAPDALGRPTCVEHVS